MAIGVVTVLMAGITTIAYGFLHSSLRPLFNMVNQKAFQLYPNELPPPISLIGMRYRGLIDNTHYIRDMEKQGLDQSNADLLFRQSETLLNGYEVITLFRRGAIEEEKRDIMLGELGFTPERMKMLQDVTTVVPSARDVIAFAVREVYSPEIAEAFGQYEGVEEVLEMAGADIKATGMAEDAFRKFWAAHWMLPSMTQGYEMMHRAIINPEELDRLMVAMDIMPWWRDKLKAMSFSPFTRVDVRRMHKIGVLGDEGLIKAYRDLGYDEENSAALAEFTILYNAGPEAWEQTGEDEEKKREKEATRASITKAFRSNLIMRDEAVEYLKMLEYTDSAIELYLTNEEFALQEEINDEKVATVHEAYVRRIYDYNKAIEILGTLNLPGAQVDALMSRWDIEKEAKVSRPSKAELFKMFKGKIIDEVMLKEELTAQGYTDKYVKWYMQFVEK